jgi:hypothetical protein
MVWPMTFLFFPPMHLRLPLLEIFLFLVPRAMKACLYSKDCFIPCSWHYGWLPLFQGFFYSLSLTLWTLWLHAMIFLFRIYGHCAITLHAARQIRNHYNFFHKSVACTGLMAPGPRHARSPKPAPGSTDRQSRLILRSPTTSEPILKI